MSDLIDRQTVIDAITNAADKWDWPDDYHHGIKEGIRIGALICSLMPFNQPEIIRCRDCKYNYMSPTAGNAVCTLLYGMINQNGFCSLAERREVSE